jgi:amino acid transporter
VNRTRRRRTVPILLAWLVIVALWVAALAALGSAPATASPPPPTDEPPVTANPFLPEQQNVGDCIGALERPGCGSEERGGWRQTLVFVIMGVGLAFVFAMVAREVRRSRRDQEAAQRDA